MNTLNSYERVADQLVSKEKTYFMLTTNTSEQVIDLVGEVTSFCKRSSPISYLGFPLYTGGQRIIHYSDLVDKVVKKISGWHSKNLSFGGKATLIKHVLLSIHIHTLSAISPPKTTLRYIKSMIADFL